MWRHVALNSKASEDQLAAYQNAIEALEVIIFALSFLWENIYLWHVQFFLLQISLRVKTVEMYFCNLSEN